jgi:hypothetical protein
VVKHSHFEGEAAACEDELFEIVLSALPLFHNTALLFVTQVLGDLFKLSVKTCTSASNGTDLYTFLSINNFHSLMNVD